MMMREMQQSPAGEYLNVEVSAVAWVWGSARIDLRAASRIQDHSPAVFPSIIGPLESHGCSPE
jgi:hypothetical protein